jgi:hypothetical protein
MFPRTSDLFLMTSAYHELENEEQQQEEDFYTQVSQ